jgi:hypothetical protein
MAKLKHSKRHAKCPWRNVVASEAGRDSLRGSETVVTFRGESDGSSLPSGQVFLFLQRRTSDSCSCHLHPWRSQVLLVPKIELPSTKACGIRKFTNFFTSSESGTMKLENTGTVTSGIEVLNISPRGFWLWIDDREHFVGFEDFPWFRSATTAQICDVTKVTHYADRREVARTVAETKAQRPRRSHAKSTPPCRANCSSPGNTVPPYQTCPHPSPGIVAWTAHASLCGNQTARPVFRTRCFAERRTDAGVLMGAPR